MIFSAFDPNLIFSGSEKDKTCKIHITAMVINYPSILLLHFFVISTSLSFEILPYFISGTLSKLFPPIEVGIISFPFYIIYQSTIMVFLQLSAKPSYTFSISSPSILLTQQASLTYFKASIIIILRLPFH